MTARAEVLARAAALRERFEREGALTVETPILQPAELLLDLYGEDIRARAYVTSDALRGEQMLRPDFTVPVVQMHMAQGAEPARYTYAGEVFRRQETDADRANEYIQVGYEVFDRTDTAAADAEVFALFEEVLRGLNLRAATGDIGILMAAVAGLDTTDARKAALMRHIWRPRRFRALLDRFAGRTPIPPTRSALLSAANPFADVGPEIGVRTRDEIELRIAALREDAVSPPLGGAQLAALETLARVRGPAPEALDQIETLSGDLPSIRPALDRTRARLAALDVRGIDTATLEFEASYGRTSMEYYDGFVFGFYAPGRDDLPAVATGGRYDALTRRLGNGSEIPAVGGVLRPGLMLQLEART
ncbi:ATP phosphoribosyltransferase regulatory subunit [Seohaeicola nanhaiensis]|uniref:Histidine--tRNA ligase n=1 Tax=Seohaeicola nanhaiensis TaxID=1387282 RepID=A0ABV9KBZ3_9RHOB